MNHTVPDEGATTKGSSLIEVLIATMILSIGLLGLMATTAYGVSQVTLTDVATARQVARQSVVERLRAQPWDSLRSGYDSVGGSYRAEWVSTMDSGRQWKDVRLIVVGPGRERNAGPVSRLVSPHVADTLEFKVLRR